MPTPVKRKPRKSGDKEGNKYDKIIKENLQSLIPALLRTVMNLGGIRLENLPQVKLQTTIEREPDFLKKMYSENHPAGCILHIEFEGKDEKETDYRMLEYGAIMVRKFKLPVEQHLVYLLEGEPQNITGIIDFKTIMCRYQVHCLWTISYKTFIHSENPEEVLLSILANYNGEPPAVVIRLMLERLIQLRGNSLATKKFIRQLEILSGLRKLQVETIKIIDSMTIEYDITKDIRYQQGEEKGIEKGIEKGLEKGETKKAITAIINMTAKDFDIPIIAGLLEVEQDFVVSIQEQMKKKEEILSLLKKKNAKVEKIATRLKVSPILVDVLKDDLGKK